MKLSGDYFQNEIKKRNTTLLQVYFWKVQAAKSKKPRSKNAKKTKECNGINKSLAAPSTVNF